MANQLGCTKHLAEKSFKINQNGGEKELFVRQIARLNFTTSPTSQKDRRKKITRKGERNILWKFLQSRKRRVKVKNVRVSDSFCRTSSLFLKVLNQFGFILYLYFYVRGVTVSISQSTQSIRIYSVFVFVFAKSDSVYFLWSTIKLLNQPEWSQQSFLRSRDTIRS